MDTEARGQVDLHFRSESSAPLHRRTLIERAGIAVNIGSQDPSVCDRLLAQMNRASAFRSHPPAGQAGWVCAEKGFYAAHMACEIPRVICPHRLGLNYLIGMSEFAADRDR